MVADASHLDDMVQALLRLVAAQQTRGGRFAQVYRWANAPQQIDYVEEWDEESNLRRPFGTERFVRLLQVLETAVAPPFVEFRDVSSTHGLEFIAETVVAESEQLGKRWE
jgi:hypothetical protein